MGTREQRLLEHDDALVKREPSIRFIRAAAICFAAMMLFGDIMLSAPWAAFQATHAETRTPSVVSTGNADIHDLLTWCFFGWAALAYVFNLKCRHIESIKLYRKKLAEQEEVSTSQLAAAREH